MSVDRIFDALAARPPKSPVLTGSARSWSAEEIRAGIVELSACLDSCGTLAILADNSPEWVVADLAALRLSIPLVPLPAFFNPQQLAHAFDLSGADCLLTDQPERIAALGNGFAIVSMWNGLTLMRRASGYRRLPAGTAKVSFTSGSTGQPKGACLGAAGLMDTATAIVSRLGELPVRPHLSVLPLALLLENTAGIYSPLLRGAQIHLPPLRKLGWQGMSGFDPAALQEAVRSVQPGSLILVPELLKTWVLYLESSRLQAPPSLAFVAVGGARVNAEMILKARANGLPAYQGYGLTECGSVVSLNQPGDDADDAGRPLDHVLVEIENGEIVIGTRSFVGYLGDDISAMLPDRHARFATGDLGRIATNGHLQLFGRRKNLIITSYGRNIAPEWVEEHLLSQPAIQQAVVAGESRPWLSAVLVPAPHADAGEVAAAVATANSKLPDYANVRDWIVATPFTPANGQASGNGRPVRAAILRHYAAPLASLYQMKEPDHAVL